MINNAANGELLRDEMIEMLRHIRQREDETGEELLQRITEMAVEKMELNNPTCITILSFGDPV